MRKKIVVFTLVLMLVLTSVPVFASQEVASPVIQNQQPLQSIDDIDPAVIDELLNSLTIGEIIVLIQQQINTNIPEDSVMASLLRTSLDQGVQSLDQLGLKPSTSLFKTKNILGNDRNNLRNTKHRPFLISVLPKQTTVTTILIAPMKMNLTNVSTPLGNVPVKLEVFIKIIPFVDRVITRQGGLVLPRLTESSIIWPTIGGRITIAGFTLFIVAFGPRIRWTKA